MLCEGGSAFILLHADYPTVTTLLVVQLPFVPQCVPLSKPIYHKCKDLILNPLCPVMCLSVPHSDDTASKFHSCGSKSSYYTSVSKSLPGYSGSFVLPCKLLNKVILHWDFDRDCEESIAQFRKTYHLHNIESSNHSFLTFQTFHQQCSVVLSIQALPLLSWKCFGFISEFGDSM